MSRQCALIILAGSCSLGAMNAASAQACLDRWSPGMGIPGINGTFVLAMKSWDTDGQGPLPPVIAIGGNFTLSGNDINSRGVAVWNGSELLPLGSGLVGNVAAFEIDRDGSLVAGGSFSASGATVTRNLARWNGVNWSEFGGGTDGAVRALARDRQGNLVVGGNFNHIGGVLISRIARWNGAGWEAMGSGIPGEVAALARGPGQVVVATANTQPGNSAINVLWNWDGNTWTNITSGGISFAGLATLPSQEVIVTGQIGNDWAHSWNGTAFTHLGLHNGSSLVGAPLVTSDGNVFVARVVVNTGGPLINGVAQFVNGQWTEFAQVTGPSQVLEKLGDQFLLGGAFTRFVGEPYYNRLAVKTNGSWTVPGTGFDYADVRAICELPDGRLAVGGAFFSIDGRLMRRIAMYDGTHWSPLGEGFDGYMKCMVRTPDGNLVAGGFFTASGSTPVSRIARWNGTSWSAMGSGFDDDVNALAVGSDGTLYAGGAFTVSGGATTSRVARWNGSAWSGLGAGVSGTVNALAVQSDGTLLAGGLFTSAGAQPAQHIAVWTGFGWSALGSGLNGTVNSIVAASDGAVYAGGSFTSAGGVAASSVARWDGAWSQVGSGLYGGTVYALSQLASGDLVAVGTFQTSAQRVLKSVAKYSGDDWVQVGEGLSALGAASGTVYTIRELSDGRLAAGGEFANSGAAVCRGFSLFGPGSLPVITRQPQAMNTCPYSAAEFRVTSPRESSTRFQWRKDGQDLSPILNPSAATDTLRINNAASLDSGTYSCLVSNDCGDVLSQEAVLAICASDFNCDSIVDFFDYLDFVAAFSVMDSRADFNDDAVIDFFDYLDFVAAFSTGC